MDKKDEPERISQVSEEMEELKASIVNLEGRVYYLGNRLSSVLTKPPTDADENCDKPAVYSERVELANDIRDCGHIIDKLISTMDNYFKRLEL